MKKSAQLLPNSDKTANKSKKKKYQKMIGFLILSIAETRSDIAFVTSIASYYTKNPSHFYIEVIKIILTYLKNFKN